MKHHVTLTVVAVCAVAVAARASAQAAATPSAGPIVVQAPSITWADGPPSLPRGAQFALLEGNPAEAVPLTLRLKFPPNYRALRHALRGDGRAGHLFGRHGAFGRQLRRDATENGALRVDRKRRGRLPAPQRRALEHHLRECERRPAPGAAVTGRLSTLS